jgi:formate hydrogenlyase transcriptional activator
LFKSTEATCPPRYEALLQVSEAISLHRDLPTLFHDLAQRLHAVVDFDFIKLVLHDDVQNVMRVHILETRQSGARPTEIACAIDESPGGLAWKTQRPVLIPHLDREIRFPKVMDLLRQDGVQSFCAVPLTTSHRRLGALGFGSRNQEAYSECDLDFLMQVSKQVAVAVDNALNFARAESSQDQLMRERDRLRLLLDVTNAVVSILDVRELVVAISKSLQREIRHDYCSLGLYHRDAHQLQLYALDFPESKGWIQEGMIRHADEVPAGIAIATKRPFRFTASDYDRYHSEFVCRLMAEGVKSGCCVPLLAHDQVLGVLNVASFQDAAFAQADADLLQQVANQISVAVENALAFLAIAELKNKLAEEKLYLEEEIKTVYDFEELVAESRALKRVLKQVEQVAPTDSTVLIMGETGTGKELIARALHSLSPRRERAFVKMNCAAIPTGLVESELFGHERGAFTGAIAQKVGRFELAHRGTLFLDEVGDLPLELQSKLLRVLQEQEFERLGGTRTIRVDVRLIAATNRDLKKMVEQGHFRSDLYYRLHVFPITVPPLRERPDDVPLLVRYFAQKYARQMNKEIVTIPTETMTRLAAYHWPGNIRELQNLIERAVILSRGPVLQVPLAELKPVQPILSSDGSATLEHVERDHILQILRETKWMISGPSGAAARLGMKRTTLYSKMQKLGIARPQ